MADAIDPDEILGGNEVCDRFAKACFKLRPHRRTDTGL